MGAPGSVQTSAPVKARRGAASQWGCTSRRGGRKRAADAVELTRRPCGRWRLVASRDPAARRPTPRARVIGRRDDRTPAGQPRRRDIAAAPTRGGRMCRAWGEGRRARSTRQVFPCTGPGSDLTFLCRLALWAPPRHEGAGPGRRRWEACEAHDRAAGRKGRTRGAALACGAVGGGGVGGPGA